VPQSCLPSESAPFLCDSALSTKPQCCLPSVYTPFLFASVLSTVRVRSVPSCISPYPPSSELPHSRRSPVLVLVGSWRSPVLGAHPRRSPVLGVHSLSGHIYRLDPVPPSAKFMRVPRPPSVCPSVQSKCILKLSREGSAVLLILVKIGFN